ncbi:uncharacterized protein [Argopecten irradians]|uniref:uncharacterized protein n=1 Tax=Argopecten irradians TaxID=31199 RepID=UPI0037189443
MLNTQAFIHKSKVKEHLRQSLEDKCSRIGGWNIFFGMNDSMIRILTPVREVLTPVPGTPTPLSPTPRIPVDTVKFTLSKLEDYQGSLSRHGIEDTSSRLVPKPKIESHTDGTKTTDKATATITTTSALTKSKHQIKKSTSSFEQKMHEVSTYVMTADRNKEKSRLSGRKDGFTNDNLGKNSRRKRQKETVSGQEIMRNGNKIANVDLQLVKLPGMNKDSNNKAHNKSAKKRNSDSRLNYANIPARCSLPPLDGRMSSVSKAGRNLKPINANEISVLPSVKLDKLSANSTKKTNVRTLPPLRSTSGRDSRRVQSTRYEPLYNASEERSTKSEQKIIGSAKGIGRLPDIHADMRNKSTETGSSIGAEKKSRSATGKRRSHGIRDRH